MILPSGAPGKSSDFVASAFAAIAFELALDLADTGEASLEAAAAEAASKCGGALLFMMPPAAENDGIETVAAVRLAAGDRTDPRGALLFVVREGGHGGRIRLASRGEIGDPFLGFASAYVRVMDRLAPKDTSAATA